LVQFEAIRALKFPDTFDNTRVISG